MKEPGIIAKLCFDFALDIIVLTRALNEKKDYVLARQLLRSGTSIGANIEEANAAQSRRDFVSKMAIASKEARETRYWLRLIHESAITEFELKPYLDKIEVIVRILTKIVKTAQLPLTKES